MPTTYASDAARLSAQLTAKRRVLRAIAALLQTAEPEQVWQGGAWALFAPALLRGYAAGVDAELKADTVTEVDWQVPLTRPVPLTVATAAEVARPKPELAMGEEKGLSPAPRTGQALVDTAEKSDSEESSSASSSATKSDEHKVPSAEEDNTAQTDAPLQEVEWVLTNVV